MNWLLALIFMVNGPVFDVFAGHGSHRAQTGCWRGKLSTLELIFVLKRLLSMSLTQGQISTLHSMR
jgi:hypothetical protein